MWHFAKKRRGDKIRNPIQGEFFATEAIEGPAQALVRESVQNSIDARLGPDSLVRVRIALATGSDALSAELSAQLFDGAWPHFEAEENGLRDPPDRSSPCPYLVVEDFGTKGLTGDPNQADATLGRPNPFFLFFRAEGLSGKSGIELGRWGVGKFVFPRSSRTSTHIGITVRHDDRRRLLLGAVTLKAHKIANDEATYTPDGLYGRSLTDGFVIPIEDEQSIDRIAALFNLSRTTEPGLSVIVPYVDPEISFDGLLSAALKDYFVPILQGRITISIENEGNRVDLRQDTIDTVLVQGQNIINPGVTQFVQLAKWAAGLTPSDRILLSAPPVDRSPKWSSDLIPEAQLMAIRERLNRNERVAVRVPLFVRRKNQEPVQSYFDIFLAPDKSAAGRPLFIREGIIIADVRGARISEMHSMVFIEDRALAGMLGDSENPAHTQWQKDSSNFRGKYTYGPGVIDFITRSVNEILGIVNRSAKEADPSLTVDFFSIEFPDQSDDALDSETTKMRHRKGREGPDSPDQIPARPTVVRISKTSGGFAIQAGGAPPIVPYVLEVRCAYDIRSGNALKKWNPADFDLAAKEISVECSSGAALIKAAGNWLMLQITNNSFRVGVSGFDVARDVYVRADVRSNNNAGTAD